VRPSTLRTADARENTPVLDRTDLPAIT
jgi:hypothetical protein